MWITILESFDISRYLQRVFLLSSVVLLAGSSVGAGAASLDKELKSLAYDHPGIRASEKAVGSSSMAIKKVRSQYYPTVTMTGDVGLERIDSPSTRRRKKDWSRTRQVAGITMTQNLYNGYFTTSSLKKRAIFAFPFLTWTSHSNKSC